MFRMSGLCTWKIFVTMDIAISSLWSHSQAVFSFLDDFHFW